MLVSFSQMPSANILSKCLNYYVYSNWHYRGIINDSLSLPVLLLYAVQSNFKQAYHLNKDGLESSLEQQGPFAYENSRIESDTIRFDPCTEKNSFKSEYTRLTLSSSNDYNDRSSTVIFAFYVLISLCLCLHFFLIFTVTFICIIPILYMKELEAKNIINRLSFLAN